MPETQQRDVRRIERDIRRARAPVIEDVLVEKPMKSGNGNPKRICDFGLREKLLYRSFGILHEVASAPFLGHGPNELARQIASKGLYIFYSGWGIR